MSLSTRLRFEILKRDGFACQYCGGRAPEVVLHIDHITPRSAGGTDDPDNLVTSCARCNLGKATSHVVDLSPCYLCGEEEPGMFFSLRTELGLSRRGDTFEYAPRFVCASCVTKAVRTLQWATKIPEVGAKLRAALLEAMVEWE